MIRHQDIFHGSETTNVEKDKICTPQVSSNEEFSKCEFCGIEVIDSIMLRKHKKQAHVGDISTAYYESNRTNANDCEECSVKDLKLKEVTNNLSTERSIKSSFQNDFNIIQVNFWRGYKTDNQKSCRLI